MLKGLFSKIAGSVGVETTPDPHTADPLTADNADWGLVYNDSALRNQRGPKSFGKHLLTSSSSSSKALEAVAEKLKKVKASAKNSPYHSSPRPFVNPWRLDATTSPATGCFTYPPAGVSDEDDRVRFRAVVASTSHGGGSGCLASARLVAYDPVRQLGVALVDGASVTIGTQGRAAPRHGGGGGVDGPSGGGYRNGACVYLFGYGGIPMDASACGSTSSLPHPTAIQAIPLPEMCCNEYWLDISISPGSHSIVLLGRDGICIIDVSSVAVVMPTTTSSSSSSSSNKKGETVFDVRYIEKPPLVTTSTAPSTLDYCFSKLCVDMPLALPFTAAGTTAGRVLFAPLHPYYADSNGATSSGAQHSRPQYWSQYEANITHMLDGSGITTLIEKRRAEARVARQERMSMGGQFSRGAVSGPQQFTPRDLSPVEIMNLDMDDEIMALSSYPSDPNAFIASTRNSWGVVKWYVIEDRLSAMFLLPNVVGPCLADCEDSGDAASTARRVYVAACKVTAGGGYVIGLTNLMTVFTWNEQNHKGKDKGVPALSRVDLLEEIPSAGIKHIDPAAMMTAASQQGIPMNGAASSQSDWSMLDSVSTSMCRDVLVTSPEHLFLDVLYPTTTATSTATTASSSSASVVQSSSHQQLKSVGNAAHAVISEGAGSNGSRRSQPGSPLSSQQQSASATEASLVSITIPVRVIRSGEKDTHQSVLYRIVMDCEQRKLQQAPGTVGVVSVIPLLGTTTIMTPSSSLPDDIDPCGTPFGGSGNASSSPSMCNGCLGGGEKERLLREGWRCRTSIVPMYPNTPWPGDPRGVPAMVPYTSEDEGPHTANNNTSSAPLFIGAYMCAVSHESIGLMSVPAAYVSPSSPKSSSKSGCGNDMSNSSAAADAMFKRFRISRVVCESPTLSTLSDYHNGSIADFSGLHCALLTTPSSSSSSSPALQVQTSVWPIGPAFSSSTSLPSNLPSPSSLTLSKNTLTIVRCHHRRLMFDKVNHLLEALQSPLSVDRRAIEGSMLCNGLLQGGSTVSSRTHKSCNPFAVDSTVSGMAASRIRAVNPRTGRAMQKLRPYVAAESDDTGYFLLHHPPTPSTSSSISRVYPYSGEQAITSSTGSLIGCAMLPPPPSTSTSPSSATTTTRTTLFSTSILGDSVTISLIRANITVQGKSKIDPIAEDDGPSSPSDQECHHHNEELYYVRVVSQRLLGADEDSDGDNDDGYSSADLADTYHPTLGPKVMLRRRFDSSAVSSGEFAIPVSEVILPKYCPMMCHHHQGSLSPSPNAPTIRTGRLLQGSCNNNTTSSTSTRNTMVPFQSLSGVSIALVMSDNTVVISSIADLVRAHEYVWGVGDRAVLREGGIITPSTIPMPQTTHIPVFLFPAGLETTSIDFFTVPMISSPSSGSAPSDGNASMLILVAAMSSATPSSSAQQSSHPGRGGGGNATGSSLFVINVTTQAVVACRRIPSDSPHTTINDLMLSTPANGHHSYLYREDGGDMSMNRSDPTFMPSALREAFQSLVPAILATSKTSSSSSSTANKLYSTLSLLCPVSDPSHPLKEVCYHETLVSAGKSIPIVSSEVCLERANVRCVGGNGARDVSGGARVYNASIASYPQINSTFPPQLPFTPSQPPPFATTKSRLSSSSAPTGKDPVSIGGATYVTLEVSLSGNMLTFSDLKDRYINAANRNNNNAATNPSTSSSSSSSPGIETVLNVSMVDLFGMPVLGVDIGVGPSSSSSSVNTSTSVTKDAAPLPPQQQHDEQQAPSSPPSSPPTPTNTSVYIRVSDATLMMMSPSSSSVGGSGDTVGSWIQVPVSAEQTYAGVSLTRCLVSGVANITLTPVAFMLGGGDVPSPLSISTASSQHARPISTELFGLCPRISGITIGTMDLTTTTTTSTGRRRCIIFSEEVSAEIIDGYDDSVRLLDVAPMVSSVGGADNGGASSSISPSSGLTPTGEGIAHMQLASYGRGAYCPHSFAPSASALNTLIYSSTTCGSVVVGDDAHKPTISLLTQLADMSIKSVTSSSSPEYNAAVTHLQCKMLDIYSKACYPVAFGVATTRSSPHSPHGQACFFNAVLRDCLDTVVSSVASKASPSSSTNPSSSSSPTQQLQQAPGQMGGGSAASSGTSIPCSAMSFTRLLSVAARHNNMGPSDLCRWRFSDDSPLSIVDDGVWDLLATGSIKGAKTSKSSSASKKRTAVANAGGGSKYSLEERMERRRKGLPVGDEGDVKESRATTTQTIMKELSVDPDAVSRLEHHTVARMCRGGADSSTLGKLSLKSDFVECGSGGIKLARVCPFSVFSLPSCVSMFTCLSTSRSAHDTDEMIQVRLSAASSLQQQGRNKRQDDGDDEGLVADRSPDPLSTMLAPYYRLSGCIPFARQRPLVFVAFTTVTSPCLALEGSGVLDGEEDLYNNTALFPQDEEVPVGEESSSSSAPKGPPADCGLNHHTRPGVVRQGGLYRSQIAVYDAADTVSQTSQLKGSAADAASVIGPQASTLQPQFVFPIPLSLIPPTHTVQGVAVVWVGGQAHCYISHSLPTSPSSAYICRVVLDDGTRDTVEDIDSDLEMEPAAEEELQRAMPEKLAAVRRAQIKDQAARKAVPRYPYAEQYQRDCPTGVCLTQHGSGLRDPFRLHTCCPPYGVSKNGRREALMDATIKASSGGGSGGGGAPWTTKRILSEGLPPPSGGTLSSTQKEQGFLKRLITTSYADQVAKVQAKGKIVEARPQLLYYIDPVSGVLQVVKGASGGSASAGKGGDAQFDDFFATVESNRLRNMTPTEKKRALLEGASRQQRGGGAGGRVGGAMSGIGETKDIMNENKQLLNERGEKIGKLELMTADMAREAETFANLTEQLKRKQRSKWFF